MAIKEKDLKLLWAKAGGRCSICREKLITDSKNESEATLVGESCHIIGEKEEGPRGNSQLSLSERNRYPNLILLCRNHHKVIDDDCSTYTIEKLHQIKSDHEVWIDEKFQSLDKVDQFYNDLISQITLKLDFKSCHWLTDNLLRLLMPVEFSEGAEDVTSFIWRAIWPGKYPELEESIKELGSRLSDYLKEYHRLSRRREIGGKLTDFFQEDKSWKEKWNNEYDKYSQISINWETRCTQLLFNYAHAVNLFSDQVRRFIDPNYMLTQGKFVIWDQLGVLPDHLIEKEILPDKFIPIDALLSFD